MSRRFLGVCALGFAVAAHAGSNDCADPHWSNTLRCKTAPAAVPQPAVAAPTSVAALRDYTRVDLTADPAVRCVDGTRPIIYIDPAVGAASNRWLIAMTGGDACNAQDLDNNGSFESGQACFDAYLAQNGQLMGTSGEPAMSDLADSSGAGIMTPDPLRNPVFAGYNRLRIHKCGFDRHSGRATHLGVQAQPSAGPAFSYDLYNHGQKIVLLALDMLRGQGAGQAGLSYTTWINNAGAVATVAQTLPSIADATQVVFLGHSAAGHGLYQNADRYRAYLQAMPSFQGDVRAIHDSHFMHAAENEAAFDPAQNPDPLSINTLFQQRYAGNSPLLGSYDAQPFFSNSASFFAEAYRAWLETPVSSYATILDASCVAAHQLNGDGWKCLDRFHVRLHHETTPALVHEDFQDPNSEHLNPPIGYIAYWGPLANYGHCGALGFSPCPPAISTQPYALRLQVQGRQFVEGVHSLSELATGADNSGPPGSVFVWMPNCKTHAGMYSDDEFFDTSLAQGNSIVRYRQYAEAFVQAPATGVINSRIHQYAGSLSECGPRLLANGFD